MASRTDPHLTELRRLHGEHGPGLGPRRLAAIRALGTVRLARARDVHALHEELLFVRAYPDDERVLAAASRALASFPRRADLARHRAELADSGIAGTTIRYAFFAPTAAWLVARHAARVTIDWGELSEDDLARLARNLWLCVLWSESGAFDEPDETVREAVRRLKGPRETDAAFLIARLGRLEASPYVRERFVEELSLPLAVASGAAGPSRTLAAAPVARIAFRTEPLRRARPDLRREIARPPRAIRELSAREGSLYVGLVKEAMVTRSRDLDAFMHADARDVRLADCGDGLELAWIGVLPERRLLLEAVYGVLMLQNGVPIGYSLASALFGSAEIAYNVFDTFRGGESAHVYGRVLATARVLFGADTFDVPPYQLGHGNEEGLASGAWWFYRKLGFRPRDARTLRTMRAEEARLARAPGRRSSRATLAALAAEPVFLSLGREREDVLGRLPLARIAKAVTREVARDGADRERAAAECEEKTRARLGLRGTRGWSRSERLALERWSPLVAALPGIARWSRAERAALAGVVRAKGARVESEYVAAFDRHRRLRSALVELAGAR